MLRASSFIVETGTIDIQWRSSGSRPGYSLGRNVTATWTERNWWIIFDQTSRTPINQQIPTYKSTFPSLSLSLKILAIRLYPPVSRSFFLLLFFSFFFSPIWSSGISPESANITSWWSFKTNRLTSIRHAGQLLVLRWITLEQGRTHHRTHVYTHIHARSSARCAKLAAMNYAHVYIHIYNTVAFRNSTR